jgi:hypothetical protein
VHAVKERLGASYFKERASAECVCEAQIWLDIPRTFPTHSKLQKGAAGCDALRDILVAYANHNQSLGYCQGMSYVAGVLLITFDSVDDAFWTFLALMDQHLSELFDARVSGMIRDGKVFDRLLAERLPALAAHLERNAISSLLYITPWWMCVYSHMDGPWTTVLRIWDIFALEGKPALFRVALAMLHLNERELLAAHGVEQILPLLHKVCPPEDTLCEFAAASLPSAAELSASIDAACAQIDEDESERPRLTPTSSVSSFGSGFLSRMKESLVTPRRNLTAALEKLRATTEFVPTLTPRTTPLPTPTGSPSKRRRRASPPPQPQPPLVATAPPPTPTQAAMPPPESTAVVSPTGKESFRAFSTASPTPKRKVRHALAAADSPRGASTPQKGSALAASGLELVVSPDAPEGVPEELADLADSTNKSRRVLRRTVAKKQLVRGPLLAPADDGAPLLSSPMSPSRKQLLLASPASGGKKRKELPR